MFHTYGGISFPPQRMGLIRPICLIRLIAVSMVFVSAAAVFFYLLPYLYERYTKDNAVFAWRLPGTCLIATRPFFNKIHKNTFIFVYSA